MDLIDRQAAIDALKTDMAALDHIINGMSGYDVRLDAYVSQRNQVNCDIYAINNLPPVQPELGTNLAEVGTMAVRGYPIDADALMEKVAEEYGERARDRLYQIIRYMPPAQHEQRTGHWIPVGMVEVVGGESAQWGSAVAYHKCSACDEQALRDDFEEEVLSKWCPHCGAKMVGVSE